MNYFEKQLEKPPMTESQVAELQGSPFTGEYDEYGNPIKGKYEAGNHFLPMFLLEESGDEKILKSIVTSDPHLDTLLENHIFVEMAQNVLPVFKRK